MSANSPLSVLCCRQSHGWSFSVPQLWLPPAAQISSLSADSKKKQEIHKKYFFQIEGQKNLRNDKESNDIYYILISLTKIKVSKTMQRIQRFDDIIFIQERTKSWFEFRKVCARGNIMAKKLPETQCSFRKFRTRRLEDWFTNAAKLTVLFDSEFYKEMKSFDREDWKKNQLQIVVLIMKTKQISFRPFLYKTSCQKTEEFWGALVF